MRSHQGLLEVWNAGPIGAACSDIHAHVGGYKPTSMTAPSLNWDSLRT